MPNQLVEEIVLSYTLLLDIEESDADEAHEAAKLCVKKLFEVVLKSTPNGVDIKSEFLDKANFTSDEVDIIRNEIEAGQRCGQIVTYRLRITAPNQSPLPNISWLTSKVRDEPSNGLKIICTYIAQIPMRQ